ncbi:MAG: elongation factor P-like protein YeiP [Gammaproteobacteria bacterium RBG_16_57_12]|nr:MAG: elongation factor P-like protein YeiP [Gammaproteobacteria bacterium RBG_16_57_12]
MVAINDQPYVVKQVDVHSPSARGASTLYKIRFDHAQTKQKLEQTFKGDDFLKEVDLIKRQVQYSYQDGDAYTFMDQEDYTQYTLNADELEGQVEYLREGLEGIIALLIDDRLLGIELPASVELEIVDTAPSIKGATAAGRAKPATLSTGLELQVPEYITVGEVVKVNTATGKFMSRV